jgi:hypothetical protein
MTDSIPDGFLADGLIVFGGPVGGLAATGFEIEMPNCNQRRMANATRSKMASRTCFILMKGRMQTAEIMESPSPPLNTWPEILGKYSL